MCVVNLVSAEPPSHYDCAAYSAKACPFLVHPSMVRRERHLPEGTVEPGGVMIRRNPGVVALVVGKYNHGSVEPTPTGPIFRLPAHPLWVEWYAHGRTATRAEALESITTGLPILIDQCDGDPLALAELDQMHSEAMRLVPQ